MNKREKEILQQQLEAEEDIIAELEKQYQRALKDIDEKIKHLQTDELTQSRIYQIEYQKALRQQIEGIVEKLHGDSYTSIQEYLKGAYTDAFVGTAYNLAGQGIPLIMPIDQNAIAKAIITDSKIKEGLYTALGVDATALKKSIRTEITRGLASGMSYHDIARNISDVSKAPLSRAKTIVRTEGHRIQQASTYDAQKAAKSKGADVVKQWDSTLDGRTRDTHRHLDGQIKEVEEPFEMDGKKAMFPGEFGDPAEDCNCRCVSLTRARWALDDEELKTLQDRAEYFGLDKTKNFEEYKEKYLEISSNPKYDVLNKVRYSGNVTPEVEKSLEESLSKMPQKHRELAETKISGIKITNSPVGSSYKRSTGLVEISSLGNPDDVIHEYAHAMAEALGSYRDPKFRAIMFKGFENVTVKDLVMDDESFVEPIYRVENKKFISKYQGRLYEEGGIFDGTNISLDGMLDYISEGYEEYIRNPTNLEEHDPDLFNYFKEIK